VKDSEISGAIVDLIKAAKEEIILVSPFNNSWEIKRSDMLKALEKASDDNVEIVAYYQARAKQNPAELFQNIVSIPVDLLHAKLYANENTVLVTSHNLTKGSLRSREIGLLVEDARVVQEVREYVKTLGKRGAKSRGDTKSRKGKIAKTNKGTSRTIRNRSDIPKKAVLTFKDDPSITCTVIRPQRYDGEREQILQVEYDGRDNWSLSDLTKYIKKGSPHSRYNGWNYWRYNGVLLSDLAIG